MKNWNVYNTIGLRISLAVMLISFAIQIGYSQGINSSQNNRDSSTTALATWAKAQFQSGFDSLNVPGATMVLVQGDSILHKAGYGVESIETNIDVSPDSSIFHVGSVSKTFIGIAVMQLVEQGLVELDEDVNRFLTSFQIEQAYDQPITVRHLLTHSGGLDELNLLHASKTEEGRITPAEHLKKRYPPQIRPPGHVFTYSNYGYAALGVMVEDISGLPFHQYVEQHILEPLGMDQSGFFMKERLEDRYVPSYRQIEDELTRYDFVFMHYYPVGRFTSTSSDMARYITMLLQQGRYGGTDIISPTTFRTMVETDFSQFDASNIRWALGFEKHELNGKTVLEHRGDIQGFTSYLVFYPDFNIGMFMSMNASRIGGGGSESREFLASFKQQFKNRLFNIDPEDLPIPESSIDDDDISLSKYTGDYRYTRYAHTTFDKVAAMIGFAPEISILQAGRDLIIPEQQDTLIHISNDLFYSEKNSAYSAFTFDIDGVDYFFRTGISSYEKLSWYESLSVQIPWIITVVLLQIAFLLYLLSRKLFSNKQQESKRKFLRANALNSILILFFLIAFVYTLTAIDPTEFTYRIPLFFKAILFIPFGIIAATFFALWTFGKNVKPMQLGKAESVFFSLVMLSSVSFLLWLNYWNLIGLNY